MVIILPASNYGDSAEKTLCDTSDTSNVELMIDNQVNGMWMEVNGKCMYIYTEWLLSTLWKLRK